MLLWVLKYFYCALQSIQVVLFSLKIIKENTKLYKLFICFGQKKQIFFSLSQSNFYVLLPRFSITLVMMILGNFPQKTRVQKSFFNHKSMFTEQHVTLPFLRIFCIFKDLFTQFLCQICIRKFKMTSNKLTKSTSWILFMWWISQANYRKFL